MNSVILALKNADGDVVGHVLKGKIPKNSMLDDVINDNNDVVSVPVFGFGDAVLKQVCKLINFDDMWFKLYPGKHEMRDNVLHIVDEVHNIIMWKLPLIFDDMIDVSCVVHVMCALNYFGCREMCIKLFKHIMQIDLVSEYIIHNDDNRFDEQTFKRVRSLFKRYSIKYYPDRVHVTMNFFCEVRCPYDVIMLVGGFMMKELNDDLTHISDVVLRTMYLTYNKK